MNHILEEGEGDISELFSILKNINIYTCIYYVFIYCDTIVYMYITLQTCGLTKVTRTVAMPSESLGYHDDEVQKQASFSAEMTSDLGVLHCT